MRWRQQGLAIIQRLRRLQWGKLIGIYLIVCLIMAVFQRSFMYVPFPGPTDPVDAGLQHFARHELTRPDGIKIIYWESTRHADQPTLLYFHGNGGGLHAFVPSLRALDAKGFHIVAMEYRGYPSAPKGPTERVIVDDGVTLFHAIQQARAAQPLVLWGYSLGSGVAVEVASKTSPRALVLEAPFTAAVDLGAELFPYLPVRWVMQDTYSSTTHIRSVHAPLLIIHGDADRVVPVAHGPRLLAAANEPKTIKIYPGFNHFNLVASPAYADAAAFIRENRSVP